MKRIGLISDTHGYLDEAVFRHFADCDEVWHAGDFGPGVAEMLEAFKPLRGVYGNIDGKDIRLQFPEALKFECEGMRVLMVHIGGYPGRYTALARAEMPEYQPGIFISGHSHILKVMYDQKTSCLHLNPGAAGKQGWHKVRTLLKFCISDGKIHNLAVVELGSR